MYKQTLTDGVYVELFGRLSRARRAQVSYGIGRAMTDNIKRIKESGLLQVIRELPAMWTGERTLTSLSHFLKGYSIALWVHSIECTEIDLPREFFDWVAYRLHFRESTMGWRKMILARIPDESAALDKFFELLDEYRVRTGTVVAQLLGHNQPYSQITNGIETRKNCPAVISLVSYTDDPGFFIVSEDPDFKDQNRFVPGLDSLRFHLSATPDQLTVINRPIFERWMQKFNPAE
jgi:hypothetical protein